MHTAPFIGLTPYWGVSADHLQSALGPQNGLFGDITNVNLRTSLAMRNAPSFAGVGITMEGAPNATAAVALVLCLILRLLRI